MPPRPERAAAASAGIAVSGDGGETWAAVTAERELLRLLGGGCQLPLGVHTVADPEKGTLHMDAVLHGMTPGVAPRFARADGWSASPEQVAAELFGQF